MAQAARVTGKQANQNPYGKLAVRHVKAFQKTQNSAMKDIQAAVKAGAAKDAEQAKLYGKAFTLACISELKLEEATARVYGSERTRILKHWNTLSDRIANGKTFGEMVTAEKMGYLKVKRTMTELFGKSRSPRTAEKVSNPTPGTMPTIGDLLSLFDAMSKGFHLLGLKEFKLGKGKVSFEQVREAITDQIGQNAQAALGKSGPTVAVTVDSEGNQQLTVAPSLPVAVTVDSEGNQQLTVAPSLPVAVAA